MPLDPVLKRSLVLGRMAHRLAHLSLGLLLGLGAIPARAVNAPPTITVIANQVINENGSSAVIPFLIGDAETPAASLNLIATTNVPTLLPIAKVVFGGSGANRTMQITPAVNQHGTANLRVRVNDADGGTNSVLLTVTVNAAPTITAIANQTVQAGGSSAAIPFTIGDLETPATGLTLVATTNNPKLFPVSRMVFAGSGASRAVTLVPVAGHSGTANVRVRVTDPAGATNSTLFAVTVNAAPTITAIGNQTITINASSAAIPFTIGDLETTSDQLSLVATTNIPSLIPLSKVVFGGSGAQRTVTITPTAGVTGTANVRVRVNDATGGTNSTLFSVTVSPADPPQTFTLSYAAAPADNPLKGFMPYQGSYAFPHSLEWFYLPLKDLQTGYSTFTWDALDAHLTAIAARGHQAIFRVYLDYPDVAYGVPDFLSSVSKHAYTDYGNGTDATSYSPDYSNPDLQRAVLNFIAALGARYDNDPRVGFITAGLLGFWGEWHTYPYDTWAPAPAFMNQVLDAFQSAFPHTMVLAREPKASVTMDRPRLGFHDDSFAYTTVGSTDWYFWPKIVAANLQDCWKNRPIGGEVRPEVQSCLWNDTPCTPADQGFDLCVSTTHASWMLNHGAFTGGLGATQLARATTGAQSLGYTLHVPRATLESPQVGKVLQGTVTLENRGVAPFYYPWTVQIAVLDKAGNLNSWPLDWDLRTVLPDSPVTRTFQVPIPGLPAGDYTLLLGVPNPMAGGHPLKFADTAQDQHKVGWLSLGAFTVKP